MGFFEVDTAMRRIVVISKSGCCDHTTEEYAVVQGNLVLVASHEEKAGPGEDQMTITRGVRQGSKWRTTTTTRALRPDEH
jgi:hypothetical protein